MNTLKHHVHQIIKFAFAFIGATTLLMWGWNSAMPDLFGLPAVQIRSAMGLMILMGIVSIFLRYFRRFGEGKRIGAHRFQST